MKTGVWWSHISRLYHFLLPFLRNNQWAKTLISNLCSDRVAHLNTWQTEVAHIKSRKWDSSTTALVRPTTDEPCLCDSGPNWNSTLLLWIRFIRDRFLAPFPSCQHTLKIIYPWTPRPSDQVLSTIFNVGNGRILFNILWRHIGNHIHSGTSYHQPEIHCRIAKSRLLRQPAARPSGYRWYPGIRGSLVPLMQAWQRAPCPWYWTSTEY